MIDSVIFRTLLDVLSVIVFMVLVVWTGKNTFILLELRSLINLMIRYLDVIDYLNPYRDAMLTLSSVIVLVVSLMFLWEYQKLFKSRIIIKNDLEQSKTEAIRMYRERMG